MGRGGRGRGEGVGGAAVGGGIGGPPIKKMGVKKNKKKILYAKCYEGGGIRRARRALQAAEGHQP